MIEYGKRNNTAEYILPWDGNCFLTKNAWQAIQEGLRANQQHNYFFVPMDRLTEPNTILLSDSYKPNPVEEPQVIFSRKAKAIFNAGLAYGNRNKVELFSRLEKDRPKFELDWQGWEEDVVRSMEFASDA